MTETISMTDLAKMSGFSLAHLCVLIKRGILPAGSKSGRQRYLPKEETIAALKTPRAQGRPKGGRRPRKLTWAELI